MRKKSRSRRARTGLLSLAVAVGAAVALVVVTAGGAAPGIGNASATEGQGVVFTISVAPADGPLDVGYATRDDTATAGSDYTAVSGTISFPRPGDVWTETVTVLTSQDGTVEPNETFFLDLTSANGDISATGTIMNDDVAPSLSVADVTVGEADGNATVTVTRTGASASDINVNVVTSNGSAVQPGDYTNVTTQVGIPASGNATATATVPVPIVNDTLDELDETFTVTLSNATGGAVIGDAAATFTITDNDNPPSLSITGAAQANEPASGAQSTHTFTVNLAPASGRNVTVDFATADGTATAGSDYTSTSGTLTFLAGETSKNVPVTLLGDAVNEVNEDLLLNLSNADGATLPASPGTVTIIDPSAPPSLSISDAVTNEGDGTLQLTVTRAGSTPGQNVTVDYSGLAGANSPSATPGSDFTLAAGTLTFAPNETTKTINVAIVNDTTPEQDESFRVVLASAVGASIARGTATVKIVDNDSGPFVAKPTTTTTKPPNLNTGPFTPATPPKVVRALLTKLLWVKLAPKVGNRFQARIRFDVKEKITGRATIIQGKRKVVSGTFELRRGLRSLYVLLPAAMKKGKVQFLLTINDVSGGAKTLRGTLDLTPKLKATSKKKLKAKPKQPKIT